jgi:hypothetical protein
MRNRFFGMGLRGNGAGSSDLAGRLGRWMCGALRGDAGARGALVEPLEGRMMMSTDGMPMTFDAAHPLSYTDMQGNKVTLAMTGPGAGVAYMIIAIPAETTVLGFPMEVPSSGYAHVLSLEISGSTNTTGFRVDVVPGTAGATSSTRIGSVSIFGDIQSVFAPALRFGDVFSVSGNASSITLGDVTAIGPAVLSLGQVDVLTGSLLTTIPPLEMPETEITLGLVSNLSIDAPGVRITQLTAKSWLETDGLADVIDAASIDGLTITGSGSIAGDFEGTLLLSGDGVADEDPTLNLVNVAGSIRNSLWEIEGNVERINARQGTENWYLEATGLVAYLTTSRSLIESSVHAQAIGVVSVRQHILDTKITTGEDLLENQFSISSVSVGGTVVDSSIDSQNTGVGTFLITGNVQGLSVHASVLTRMNTGVSVYDSVIQAGKIGTIFVSLDMKSSLIHATAGVADGQVSMGNVTVYAIAQSSSVVSDGSVDNMRFGHLVDSYVGVGVVSTEGDWWFAQTATGQMAGINTVYLSGTIGYTDYQAMSDSEILAGHLGSVRVYSVDETVESDYGIKTTSVDLYQRRKSDGSVVKLTDLVNESSEEEIEDSAGGYRLILVTPVEPRLD